MPSAVPPPERNKLAYSAGVQSALMMDIFLNASLNATLCPSVWTSIITPSHSTMTSKADRDCIPRCIVVIVLVVVVLRSFGSRRRLCRSPPSSVNITRPNRSLAKTLYLSRRRGSRRRRRRPHHHRRRVRSFWRKKNSLKNTKKNVALCF